MDARNRLLGYRRGTGVLGYLQYPTPSFPRVPRLANIYVYSLVSAASPGWHICMKLGKRARPGYYKYPSTPATHPTNTTGREATK